MLLAAHELGLGTCWIGEILKKENEVNQLVGAPQDYELMAMIAIGYYEPRVRNVPRKPLDEVVLKWM